MKKSIFLFMSLILFSCTTEEEPEQTQSECDLEIWGMNSANDNYEIEYGDEDETTTVEVDETTYDYYWNRVTNDISDCWEGHR